MKSSITLLFALCSLLASSQSLFQNLSSFYPIAKAHTRATISKPGHSENYQWNSAWEHTGSTDYSYDASGNEILALTFDTTGVLVYKTSSTYNAQGSQTEWLSVSYSAGDADSNRSLSYYDTHGNQTQYLSQHWESDMWVTYYGTQYVLTYNVNDNLVDMISQQYNSGAWVNDYHVIYTVDGSGTISALEQQLWNGSNWQNSLRYVNLVWYDQDLLKPSYFMQQGFGTGSYTDTLQHFITYDAFGGSVQLLQSYNGSTWTDASRYTDTYDSHYNAVEYKSEVWQSGAWIETYGSNNINTYNGADMIERVLQFWETTQYTNNIRQVYSGFQYFTSIASFDDNNNITIFPNPASDVLHISSSVSISYFNLVITDCLGRIVMKKGNINTVNGVALDVSQLPFGYYLMILTDGVTQMHKNFVHVP